LKPTGSADCANGSGSSRSPGIPGNAPITDSGTTDGSNDQELARLANFDTGTNRIRIQDAISGTTLTEVKNVDKLSYTQQIRDYAAYASQNGLKVELHVRPSTTLSGPLQQAINNGQITLKVNSITTAKSL
jgi:Restriction endonuclease fold toxin 7